MDIDWSSWVVPSVGIRSLSYEEAFRMERLPAGPYIFSDLERLSVEETKLAAELWNTLAGSDASAKLLNHPQRSLRRYDLLRTLQSSGRNDFRVYRATASRQGVRFPVFVRQENEHDGSLTPLIGSEMELTRALNDLRKRGYPAGDLLIVEFCKTSDPASVFRKYSAFRVGERILPRRLLFGSGWMVKNNSSNLIDARSAAEEREYLERNPHERQLREIFELARIQYGRVDYGVLGERVQVWEINTNPSLLLEPQRYHPLHLAMQQGFAERFALACRSLDGQSGETVSVPVRLDRAHLDAVNRLYRQRGRAAWWRRRKRAIKTGAPRLSDLLRRMRGFGSVIRSALPGR